MARQYGNTTGNSTVPDIATGAPGSWISTTEVYRETNVLSEWPKVPVAPSAQVGAYVLVVSSGVKDTQIATGNFLLADGSNVSRTTYSTLFNVIGTTYGSGNGSTTFTLPNLTGDYSYLVSTTTSGLSLSSLSGVGSLPIHNHSISSYSGTTSSSHQNFDFGGGGIVSTSSATFYTGLTGSVEGNQARHRQTYPLISVQTQNMPTGSVVPVLLPTTEAVFRTYANTVSSFVVIASGQTLSRTAYSNLFSQIGTLYGSGDGSTTFNVPDYRGIFLKNTNPAQVSGTLPSGYILDSVARHQHLTNSLQSNPNIGQTGGVQYNGPWGAPATGAATGPVVGTESRPANISVVYMLVV